MAEIAASNTGLEQQERIAREIRGQVIQMSHDGSAPHLGSALSCVDLLVGIHFGVLRCTPEYAAHPDRDRCILSKGHAAMALYATLAKRGYFPEKLLSTFNKPGSLLGEQPIPGSVPGIEVATGSLGHGLPVGLGMALAARITGRSHRVFVVMSDGECNEGSNWEAAIVAPAHKLNNLVVLIDYNKWQATGRSQEITSLDPLIDKWRAFGWRAREINGHNLAEIHSALSEVPLEADRPTAIIAHTTKGKGVSFMEDDNNWHYRLPQPDEVLAAHKELGLT